MPLLNGPSCITTVDCPAPTQFPTTPVSCKCTTAKGGVADIYPIPCSEDFTETNFLDLAWWQGLIDANKFAQLGKGLGSISKKNDQKEQMSSCAEEEVVGLTWALTFTQKCFDKTSSKSTVKQVKELLTNASGYFFVARMCDGDDTLLPIGRVNISDFDWNVPETSKEIQTRSVEMSWEEFGLPEPIVVPGLSSIIPK